MSRAEDEFALQLVKRLDCPVVLVLNKIDDVPKPALLPGESWTLSFQVKLSASAKKTSTLSLVGTAGGASAKGALVVKSLG